MHFDVNSLSLVRAANMSVILGFVVGALVVGVAQAEGAPSDAGTSTSLYASVKSRAELLSKHPYVKPKTTASSWLPQSYDTYRQLRFNPEWARWRSPEGGFEVHLLPGGWLFKVPVTVHLVENGEVSVASATPRDFIDGRQPAPDWPEDAGQSVPLSGFRINWPLNDPSRTDEVIVFQGASYFRALARGQRYGLSARGLAIGTASADGEEFPAFREFWITRPAKGVQSIVIHALLDSPSTTGAYRFVVSPGKTTRISVEGVLFPRRDIADVGIAPLTSMFLVGPVERRRIDDFRPQVHDSDGLAIANGHGERIWRPLTNPRQLQVSAFVDTDNKGFGLIQRARSFRHYQDLEAHYELRPSAWVKPQSGFGKGSVKLVEIPTEQEIHDNIVSYWSPATPLEAGRPFSFSYELGWQVDTPSSANLHRVAASRAGVSHFAKSKQPVHLFVIDYQGDEVGGLAPRPVSMSATDPIPEANVSASHGQVRNVVVRENSETGGVRVSFEFAPDGAKQSELRLDLVGDGKAQFESWFYRWNGRR